MTNRPKISLTTTLRKFGEYFVLPCLALLSFLAVFLFEISLQETTEATVVCGSTKESKESISKVFGVLEIKEIKMWEYRIALPFFMPVTSSGPLSHSNHLASEFPESGLTNRGIAFCCGHRDEDAYRAQTGRSPVPTMKYSYFCLVHILHVIFFIFFYPQNRSSHYCGNRWSIYCAIEASKIYTEEEVQNRDTPLSPWPFLATSLCFFSLSFLAPAYFCQRGLLLQQLPALQCL